MANEEHLAMLLKGVEVWNQWRRDNPELKPDLSRVHLSEADLSETYLIKVDLSDANLSDANLSEADLRGVDFVRADLRGANLSEANLLQASLLKADLREADLVRACLVGAILHGAILCEANLREANLQGAHLNEADLRAADLRLADLRGADLSEANLGGIHFKDANLSGANLSGADLSEASFVRTILDDARLDSCRVYGISVWDVSVKGISQFNLVVTSREEDAVTVDDLKLAQFIHLLLKNEEVRHIIDTITSKVVLILGRFTEERKQLLSTLRNELRARDYTPILFDFDKPSSRDLTETILTLASMARFVIADLSAAKSIPQELSHIIPNLPSVPIQPVLLESDYEYAMFEHWKLYPWVLPDFLYEDEAHLLASLVDKVIEPAEKKRQEQTKA